MITNEADKIVFKLIKAYGNIENIINDEELAQIYRGRFFWLCDVLGWSMSRFCYLSSVVKEKGGDENSLPCNSYEYLGLESWKYKK